MWKILTSVIFIFYLEHTMMTVLGVSKAMNMGIQAAWVSICLSFGSGCCVRIPEETIDCDSLF